MEEEGGKGVFHVIAQQNLIGEVVALKGWVGWGAIDDVMGQVVALEEDHRWVAASGSA